MVISNKKHSRKTPGKQGPENSAPEPNRINASTHYDFTGKNLTPYGGLLPVITMLEKLGFQSLVEKTVTSQRIPRAMDCTDLCWGLCSVTTSAFRGSTNCATSLATRS